MLRKSRTAKLRLSRRERRLLLFWMVLLFVVVSYAVYMGTHVPVSRAVRTQERQSGQ